MHPVIPAPRFHGVQAPAGIWIPVFTGMTTGTGMTTSVGMTKVVIALVGRLALGVQRILPGFCRRVFPD